MSNTQQRTFIENPFNILIIITPVLIILYVFIFAGVSIFGYHPTRRGAPQTSEGFLIMIFFAEAIVFLIVLITVSFQKKRTMLCNYNSCEIYGSDFWGISIENEIFKWSEVTQTDLTYKIHPKGGKQLDFIIKIESKEIRLLTKTLINHQTFADLIDISNRMTPHLTYEWIKKSVAQNRKTIVSKGKYCKVSRN